MGIKINLSDITMRESSGILNGSEISGGEDTEIQIHGVELDQRSQILCNEKIGEYRGLQENLDQEKMQTDGRAKEIFINVISDLIGKILFKW